MTKEEMEELNQKIEKYKNNEITPEEREELKKKLREGMEKESRLFPMKEHVILMEGVRPGELVMTAEGKIEKRELPPVEEWKDIRFLNMTILDMDELWGHTIYCNKCGTYFQAYKKDGWKQEDVFNYCPGCGCELVDRRDVKTVEQIKKILED